MRCLSFIRWITIVVLLGSSLLALGQNTAVLTGSVEDAATGKPMPFANVYINGSTQGAVSDEKGAYTLTAIPLGTVEIVASFVGYQPEKQTLRFDNTSTQKANFRLKPSVQMLDAVVVRGNSKRGERHLREFKKKFFGEPFGGQCQLLNSEVLSFKEEKGHLYATASEPLIIDNQALGYRLIYDLQHFDANSSGKVYSGGTARFEALKPENEKQAERFRRNQLTAYKGSTRHLMTTLINNTYEQAGFLIYQEDMTRPILTDTKSVSLAAAVNEYKRLVPVTVSTLIQPGRLSVERRLVSPMKLVVFFTNATSGFSPYPDARYAYTEITLPKGHMQMTVDGVITAPEGMETKGSMGNDRLSTMLPADWKPEGNEKELLTNQPLSTQGKLAPPDSSIQRIIASFNSRFKVLAPSIFVHIDKPVYVTGDRLWMSTYLLDATNSQRIVGEAPMHVDLLTQNGKSVQHQWVRMVDGRGQGNFRLADSLATGTYRLRAYTDEDDAQRGPAFERDVLIYNLLPKQESTLRDSVQKQPDIQVLPEGGRWISGLPARLGIKIVHPDGHGIPIAGRIVDELGAEVVRFQTNEQGMTSVSMQPDMQRTYFAEATFNKKLQRVPLPKPEVEGISLSADAISDTTRLALTIMSSKHLPADSAYILIQQRGRIVDQRKIILENGVAKISLPMMSWLPGLAQITLYDALSNPRAERLIFVPEFTSPVKVTLGFNKARYQPREEVALSVSLNDNGAPVSAALSASVTDVDRTSDDNAEASFRTHLLLTGELRGHIENANRYTGTSSAETRKALDDLLLTQGWRRVSGVAESETLDGISIRGHIVNAKNQPIPQAQVSLISTKPGQPFAKSEIADDQGYFRLKGISLVDTVQLMIQLADHRLKKFSPKEAFLFEEQVGKFWEFAKPADAPAFSSFSKQLEAARSRQDADVELYRDKSAKVLNEVTVRARKTEERPEDIQRRSLHNEADATLIFDDKSPVYNNLYEMMQGRLAGVTVSRTVPGPTGPPVPPGYRVYIRGLNSFTSGTQPLFLMDGVPIQDPDGTALMHFNSRDIERIEVLKNASSVGIYGVRGGNGVIAFYTKTVRSTQGGANNREFVSQMQFIGYPSVQRQFYVPRYDAETNTNAISGPVDQRDVLYWKPLMITDSQGRTQLRFPLSDVVRTVRVVIQGITDEGHPVSDVQLIRVQ